MIILNLKIVNFLLWLFVMIIASYFDSKRYRVPNLLFYIAIPLSFLINTIEFIQDLQRFVEMTIATIIIVFFLEFLAFVRALGGADLKSFLLFLLIGIPIKNTNIAFLSTMILIFLILLIGLIHTKYSKKEENTFPLIPFICLIGTILLII